MFASRILLASKRSADAVERSGFRIKVAGQRLQRSSRATLADNHIFSDSWSDDGTSTDAVGWSGNRNKVARQSLRRSSRSPPDGSHIFSDSWSDHTTEASTAPIQQGKQLLSSKSLADQLFADSWSSNASTRTTAPIPSAREVPLLPLDVLGGTPVESLPSDGEGGVGSLREDTSKPAADEFSSILLVRRASANLTMTDFRRLIPQGQHLEGWTRAGDIVKVVPGRRRRDLHHLHEYYLHFKSYHDAKVFSDHIGKLFELTQQYAPQSPFFERAPDVLVIDGISVSRSVAALQAVTGHQAPLLEHVRLPLNPLLQNYNAEGGPPKLMRRPRRMPFELRLQLEGSRIKHLRSLRRYLDRAGSDRGLPWTGRSDVHLMVDGYNFESSEFASQPDESTKKYTPPQPVYVVGFETDESRLSFLHYWHRRPLVEENTDDWILSHSGDLPPIVDLELL